MGLSAVVRLKKLGNWHEQIGDPTIADAILDRLIHNAHKIHLKGKSMRKKELKEKINNLKEGSML